MKPFRRALAYLPRYRRQITIGLAAIPISQALSMTIPWLIGRGIDQLSTGSLVMPLWAWFSVIAVLAAVRGVTKYLMRYHVVGASRRMEEDLRNDVFRHLLRLPPAYFQAARSGDLMTRVTSDVEAVRMFLGPGVMYVTETLLVLPPALIILAWFDPLLASLMLVPLALIVIVMKASAQPVHRESQKGQELLAELSNQAHESFAGVRVLRTFARHAEAHARFAAASEAYSDQMVRVARVRGLAWATMSAARDVGVLLLISAGCVQLVRGQLTLGQFVVFNMYLGLLFWPMVALGWMIAMYQRARVSMERIDAILDHPPAIPASGAAAPPARVRGAVEIRNLVVRRGDQTVLNGIDLNIPPGAVVGITGGVGSGKSTLAQVLPRLVDVPPGAVFLDGQDIVQLDATSLRHAIGYVPQEAFLFADSVLRNVAFGRADEDEPAVRAALRAARVDGEIEQLPRGIHSVVGERGVTLSGGQRQRCTIARALAKDPAVLVFDDCLSAVDAQTEAEILESMRSAVSGRTALIVSHRVAAMRLADHVVVLADGRVVETGSPIDLLQGDGPFRRMYERQQAEQELDRLA